MIAVHCLERNTNVAMMCGVLNENQTRTYVCKARDGVEKHVTV